MTDKKHTILVHKAQKANCAKSVNQQRNSLKLAKMYLNQGIKE